MEDPSWHHAWPLVAWRISGDTMYARKCRQDTVSRCYEWQIRRQIRTIIGSETFLRHEGALLRAAVHDTFFEGVD
jgi:hypothetical protein